jgi:succinate-acetate transporter protein
VELAEVVPVFVWTYNESASPVFTFFGGMLQIIGGTGEWILGNTFSSVLFFTYGK